MLTVMLQHLNYELLGLFLIKYADKKCLATAAGGMSHATNQVEFQRNILGSSE